MSMDYSEFLLRLGADPDNQDPEFLRAREASPEFQQAAQESIAFEALLTRAVTVPAPDDLLNDLLKISADGALSSGSRRGWWPMALAASILISVAAVGMGWKMSHRWESVDQYLVQHYRHDGQSLIDVSGQESFANIQKILARFDIEAAPGLAQTVGVIKYCPTPDGKGVHMVLNTDEGPVTVIYMPETQVVGHEIVEFDEMRAVFVDLEKGSAIIIGTRQQSISELYAFVYDSFIPTAREA